MAVPLAKARSRTVRGLYAACTRPRGLYALCILGCAVYCWLNIMLLWRTGTNGAASTTAAVKMTGRLCWPSAHERTLLVEIPFTRFDAAALELTVNLWEQVWPCYRSPLRPSRPDLVFGFNGNLSERQHDALRAQILGLADRAVVRECFGRVSVESAGLSGIADTYDKRRLDANWTVGPNNLFVHFLRRATWRGYRYMVQLEPDVLPLRARWLEQLHCLAATSSAWVIGSPFLGQCAHDAHSQVSSP